MSVTWIAEHRVVWLLPSGERRPGKIAIGCPEQVAGTDEFFCPYVLEGVRSGKPALRDRDTLQAMYWAWQMIGHELYWLLSEGVRVIYPGEEEDPEAATARLILSLGPLVRANGSPRGVADAEDRLAALEELIEEERRRWDPGTEP